jgi:hypothetical protein
MTIATFTVSVLAAIISLASAFAAWRAIRPIPKLKGSLTSAWHIGVSYTGGEKAGLAILLHIVLTNASSNPVHLLGYRLRVNVEDSWQETERLRNQEYTFPELYLSNEQYVATLGPEFFLDWPPRPVAYGTPLMGFLCFFALGRITAEMIAEYELVVSDVFGNHEKFNLTSSEAKAWQEEEGDFNVVDIFRYSGANVQRVDSSTETIDKGTG